MSDSECSLAEIARGLEECFRFRENVPAMAREQKAPTNPTATIEFVNRERHPKLWRNGIAIKTTLGEVRTVRYKRDYLYSKRQWAHSRHFQLLCSQPLDGSRMEKLVGGILYLLDHSASVD